MNVVQASVRDHMGREHTISSAEDINRLVADIDRAAVALAEIMLGPDRQAAKAAEAQSDNLEDVFMPRFAQEVARIAELLNDEAADAHRRAKALDIKARRGEGK